MRRATLGRIDGLGMGQFNEQGAQIMNLSRPILILTLGAAIAACEQTPRTYTAAEVKQICEEERRDAQGPRTNMTIGANSVSGMVGGVGITFNDKFIRGVDPDTAYQQCLERFTAQPES